MKTDEINVNIEGGADYTFPPLLVVDQIFDGKAIDNIFATINAELDKVATTSIAGQSIAITVGSRGIDSILEIVKALVIALKGQGGKPFIVPSTCRF